MELTEPRCSARSHRPEDGRGGTGHEGGLSPPEAARRPAEKRSYEPNAEQLPEKVSVSRRKPSRRGEDDEAR